MSGNARVLKRELAELDQVISSNMDAKTKRMSAPPIKQSRAKGRLNNLEAKAFRDVKSVPGVSVFAVIGTIIVSTLMVFVVLAQINYNEAASETVRLSTQIRELNEQHRRLELAFESSFDIKEVERIARDELGMSRPDAAQIIITTTAFKDTAFVVHDEEEQGEQGFADFLRSLTDYFRR